MDLVPGTRAWQFWNLFQLVTKLTYFVQTEVEVEPRSWKSFWHRNKSEEPQFKPIVWFNINSRSTPFSFKSVNSGKELKSYLKRVAFLWHSFLGFDCIFIFVCWGLKGTNLISELLTCDHSGLVHPHVIMSSCHHVITCSSPIWNSDWGSLVMSSLCWPLQLPPNLKPPWGDK